MRWSACVPWLSALAVLALGGCAENSMVLKGQLSRLQQQQLAASRQNQLLQDRAAGLDRDNQELESELAQARQQHRVVEDQLAAVREQLRDTTSQLAQARGEKESSDKRVQALSASMRRSGSISITPNNSLLQTLPTINLPDVHTRRDGDVIRVELPGSRLFESGSARLQPGATTLITDAAAQLLAAYPDQMLGVEGHTDSDPVTGRQWRNNHELSVARALAVYDVLVSRTRYRPGQLFIVGHGANHPVVSNATPEGKKRNRRIELVVYPERRGEGRGVGDEGPGTRGRG
jgi:flagellar motor protein MotB